MQDSLDSILHELDGMEPFLIQSVKASPPRSVGETLRDDRQLFWKKESPMKEFKKEIQDIIDILREMGPYCTRNAVLMKMAYFTYLKYKDKKKNSNSDQKSAERLVLVYLVQKLKLFERQLINFMFYASPKEANEAWCATNFISPKVKALLNVFEASRFVYLILITI